MLTGEPWRCGRRAVQVTEVQTPGVDKHGGRKVTFWAGVGDWMDRRKGMKDGRAWMQTEVSLPLEARNRVFKLQRWPALLTSQASYSPDRIREISWYWCFYYNSSCFMNCCIDWSRAGKMLPRTHFCHPLEFILKSSVCYSAKCGWKMSQGSSVDHFSPLWMNHSEFSGLLIQVQKSL